MTEPDWAAGLRAHTEALIEKLSAELPKNAGPVAIERILTQLEPDYFNGITQVLIDAAPEKKKPPRLDLEVQADTPCPLPVGHGASSRDSISASSEW